VHRTEQQDSFVRNQDGTLGFYSNPITGCLKRCSYCYAMIMANDEEKALKQQYLANNNIAPIPSSLYNSPYTDPFYPRFKTDELQQIRRRQKHAGIFICDMGELFGDWIPRAWQDAVFDTMRSCPQHRFYLLTKQPQNLHLFSPYPENCWVGVSATDEAMTKNALLHLKQIEVPIKYICFSPLLGKIDIDLTGIDWGIVAARNHPHRLPQAEWVTVLVNRLEQIGAKVFLQDSLNMGSGRREIP